jgi:hypothetical protein
MSCTSNSNPSRNLDKSYSVPQSLYSPKIWLPYKEVTQQDKEYVREREREGCAVSQTRGRSIIKIAYPAAAVAVTFWIGVAADPIDLLRDFY